MGDPTDRRTPRIVRLGLVAVVVAVVVLGWLAVRQSSGSQIDASQSFDGLVLTLSGPERVEVGRSVVYRVDVTNDRSEEVTIPSLRCTGSTDPVVASVRIEQDPVSPPEDLSDAAAAFYDRALSMHPAGTGVVALPPQKTTDEDGPFCHPGDLVALAPAETVSSSFEWVVEPVDGTQAITAGLRLRTGPVPEVDEEGFELEPTPLEVVGGEASGSTTPQVDSKAEAVVAVLRHEPFASWLEAEADLTQDQWLEPNFSQQPDSTWDLLFIASRGEGARLTVHPDGSVSDLDLDYQLGEDG